MAAKRVTLHEVAKRAGVGVSSVSRVMGDYPGTSKEMRERVLEGTEYADIRIGRTPEAMRRHAQFVERGQAASYLGYRINRALELNKIRVSKKPLVIGHDELAEPDPQKAAEYAASAARSSR